MTKKTRSPGNVKAIVAAHDRLILEVEVLKSKLQDEAGDYLRRIEDQKTRVHRLEKELNEIGLENHKLKEIIIEMLLKAKE